MSLLLGQLVHSDGDLSIFFVATVQLNGNLRLDSSLFGRLLGCYYTIRFWLAPFGERLLPEDGDIC